MFGGRGGFDSKQLRKMMKQMGIEMEELSGVEEVTIKMSDKELVFTDPEVQLTEAQGQKTYQIIGKPTERELGPEISDEDVKMVVEQTDVDEETARKALEETEGDIAQAIVNLGES
ncbi:hypothetical protein AKJ37_00470 [candidate division MSBL1 archaeon SCGC-AAA259I09]|uniref:Nascent polypeptide-associated complex protein n=4 Tax=candidate division MSBL1 TaxID=215777 RepID=A0A133UW05_9EURY|nr:hypothetical protein AKJ66_02395 [candidate division MSBL1 archaeon SCGC-AAA259E22]KXA98300.1 hypothetical protein AKJ37_00470 [candidate division MSBL1 archaeon SCGC-AAA259I09]KXA98563.1 hypothetical protein AKJ39_01590 [candidate division MSBL1 archaeon SCGC-AAA259J03]KXA99739.1 hypothetical protein AKJ40_02500 [candidate division MSBL1 archaeon SCGC-AAA259M10]